MKVILEIPESRASFFMELLRNFSFVKVHKDSTKQKALNSIKQGLKEVKLVEQGKLKSRSAREFLNEL